MTYRRKLLGVTALPLIAAMGTGIFLVNPPARAQTNPCAPAARPVNPCAPAKRAANPCAAASPGKAANPCAAAKAANPCAARPAIVGAAANPYDVAAKHKQAPYVGTGGIVDPKGYAKLKALGFKTIINLNTEKEGAKDEGDGIMAAGLDYISIPVATLAPDSAQVAAFSKYVNDPKFYPILVHCESSNRVGAMWALYRTRNGVPPEIAIQEGRTVGLKPSREKAVRTILNLPTLAN